MAVGGWGEAGGEPLLCGRELRGRTRRRGRRVPPHLLDSHHSFYDGLYVGGVADARIRPALRTLKQNLSLLLVDRAQPVAVREASGAARRSGGRRRRSAAARRRSRRRQRSSSTGATGARWAAGWRGGRPERVRQPVAAAGDAGAAQDPIGDGRCLSGSRPQGPPLGGSLQEARGDGGTRRAPRTAVPATAMARPSASSPSSRPSTAPPPPRAPRRRCPSRRRLWPWLRWPPLRVSRRCASATPPRRLRTPPLRLAVAPLRPSLPRSIPPAS